MSVLRPPATDRGVWICAFLFLFAMAASWSLASPYNSAPDEPAHSMRAWAVAHGQLFASHTSDPEVIGGVVEVPPFYAHSDPACFAFQPNQSAGCQELGGGSGTVSAATTAARAPAYVYGIVGLPTLLLQGAKGFMAMRLWQAALCSALIASACVSARRRRWGDWMPVALLIAITPMVVYLSGTINPSGLEIAGAIGMWVSGLVLVGEESIDRRVLGRFVVAALVVAGTRQLGPLMVLLIVAALLAVGGMVAIRRLMASREVRIGAVIVSVVAVLMVLWVVTQHTFATANSGVVPPTISDAQMWRDEIGRIWYLYRQSIGWFGWLDTPAPALTFIAWILATGTIALVGLSLARRRVAVTMLALLAVIIVLPIMVEVPNFRVSSYAWQGRYTLPLIVGVPLLAAFGLAQNAVRRPSSTSPGLLLGAVLLWIGHVLAFAQALRRYTVGADGGVQFWNAPQWQPVAPIIALLVMFAVATAAWLWSNLAGAPCENLSGPTGSDLTSHPDPSPQRAPHDADERRVVR